MSIAHHHDPFPPEIRNAYLALKADTLAALEAAPCDFSALRHQLHRLCGTAGMFDEAHLGTEAGQFELELFDLAPDILARKCRSFALTIRASLSSPPLSACG